MSKLQSFFEGFAQADEKLDVRIGNESNVIEKVPVTHTGSYALDDALSAGGYPDGRLIQIYGPPGSGKSLLAMLAMKEAQQRDLEANQLFIDAEQTFDASWAKTLGLDTSRIVVIQGELAILGRRCFEMLLGVPKEDQKTHAYNGKKKDGLLDKIVNKELNFNIIVLDSLGALIPPGEDISAVGKNNISLMARFLSTTLKKLALEVNKAKIPMIIINHVRSSMDMYGPDHTYSGGNSYTHFLSANIYVEGVNRKDAIIFNEKEEKVGSLVKAHVEKSKFGPPRKCEFKVHYGIGIIEKHKEIGQLAIDYNIVERPNNVMYSYNGESWKGADNFFSALEANPVMQGEFLEKVEKERSSKWDRERENQLKVKEAEPTEEDSKSKKTKKKDKTNE